MNASLLSVREIQALYCIATGQSVDRVAESMFVARDTVKNYLRDAYEALGAHERGHAVAEAFRLGYLAVDPVSRQIVANPYGRPVRDTREKAL